MQLKFIKENQKAFKNIPDIKKRINKNKKLVKMLKKFLDITWIDDPELFNQINNDVTNRYRKYKNSTELLSIQDFLDDKIMSILKIRMMHLKNLKI